MVTSRSNQQEPEGVVMSDRKTEEKVNKQSYSFETPDNDDEKQSTKARAKRRKWSKIQERTTEEQEDDDEDGSAVASASSGSKISAKALTKKETKKRKKKEERKKKLKGKGIEKKKKKLSHKAILFSEPNNTEQIDPLSNLPPLHERLPIFHGLSAMSLASGTQVQQEMDDKERHEYFTGLTGQCQSIVTCLHNMLTVVEKSDNLKQGSGSQDVSVEEELTSDLARLKHTPLAKRYVEMTLWKRISKFQDDSMTLVRDLNYGELDHVNPKANIRPGNEGSDGPSIREADSTDLKFNSFRDKYLKHVLEHHEEDLERIRVNEAMDEDHVKFLRHWLDTSAALYANVKCWDDDQQDKSTNVDNSINVVVK